MNSTGTGSGKKGYVCKGVFSHHCSLLGAVWMKGKDINICLWLCLIQMWQKNILISRKTFSSVISYNKGIDHFL